MKHTRARWFGLVLLLLGVPWVIYALLARVSDVSPVTEANRFLLPALSLALVVLTLGLAGVLIRTLVKLLIERRRGILGSNLRIKLVFFYLALVLLPSSILFIGSAKVIKDTVEAILRDPLDQLKRGHEVVDAWTDHFRSSTEAHARSIALDLAGRTVSPERLREQRRAAGLQWIGYYRGGAPVTDSGSDSGADLLAAARRAAPALAERAVARGTSVAELHRAPGALIVLAAASTGGPDAGVVVTALAVPPPVALSMERISGADQDYRRFRVQRRELVRFYLTLIGLIFIATLFVATWIGLYVARRITVPLQEVAAASREISAGNLGVRVRTRVGDEMGMLVDAFNEMAAELQENREVISRSTADLRRSNRELNERRRYIETLVENLSTAVVSLDPDGRVTTSNPALGTILGMRLRPGDDALAELRANELDGIAELLDAPPKRGTVRRNLELPESKAVRRVSVQISPLEGPAGESPGTLMMIEDLSDLLRAQRALAWQEVARRIAHEIKNPLTPIQLAAQRLRKKLETDPEELGRVIVESTASIEHEVQGLKRLVDEFSRYARMPETEPRPVEFHEVVRSVLALYEGVERIEWELDLDPALGFVTVDPQQMRRALVNLVDNAIAAVDGEGRIRIATGRSDAGTLRIEITDSGPGIPHGDRDKMFVPYFSTKKRGTGLGLAIVHKIVSDHRGTIRVEDSEPSGAKFVIEIPA